jgi:hypothetical protein
MCIHRHGTRTGCVSNDSGLFKEGLNMIGQGMENFIFLTLIQHCEIFPSSKKIFFLKNIKRFLPSDFAKQQKHFKKKKY